MSEQRPGSPHPAPTDAARPVRQGASHDCVHHTGRDHPRSWHGSNCRRIRKCDARRRGSSRQACTDGRRPPSLPPPLQRSPSVPPSLGTHGVRSTPPAPRLSLAEVRRRPCAPVHKRSGGQRGLSSPSPQRTLRESVVAADGLVSPRSIHDKARGSPPREGRHEDDGGGEVGRGWCGPGSCRRSRYALTSAPCSGTSSSRPSIVRKGRRRGRAPTTLTASQRLRRAE